MKCDRCDGEFDLKKMQFQEVADRASYFLTENSEPAGCVCVRHARLAIEDDPSSRIVAIGAP